MNEQITKDRRFADMDMDKMPLDGKRTVFCGFEVLV